MYFKSIYMHGFKSFAEPVTIEFNKGITCVVGPNGSGKSNISDAVRWVLGEQSPKMLRGGKMEEVIFSGTASRKSRGMAEVTLTIDNSDHTLNTDYNEVAITRRMFRSGESEYFLNRNQCRLRDIRELIMDTGIGVDGYSVIGQGRISDIISNKTESRREIFEEAAGIVMYRTKKESSEKKLSSAKDNLERINDIIHEIDGRIDGLREESIKAREFVEVRDRLRTLEINIILSSIDEIEDKVKTLEDEEAEILKELNAENSTITETDERISKKRAEKEETDKEKTEAASRLLELVNEINELVNRKQVEEEKLSYIEQNSAKLREETGKLKEKYESEKTNFKNLTERKNEIDGKVSKMSDELQGLLLEQEKLVLSVSEKSQKSEKAKKEAETLRSRISAVTFKVEEIEKTIETLDRKYIDVSDEKSSGDDGIKDALDDLNRIKNEREKISVSLGSLKEELEILKENAREYAEDEARKSAKIKENEIEMSRLSGRMKTIEEMESNYEGYNAAVKFIMKSGVSGIDNVVAGIIEVPEGNETAIETALGPSLQNIVCSDDSSARNAIAVLKENKAGRLTFLPKNMIRANPLRDEKVSSSKGFIGYGTDCVSFDPGYREVMEYLLGRTAVFDNIENASAAFRKGAKGIRIVTLDGEIINPAGALTGGKYRNKMANLLDRKAEIRLLKKTISEKKDERAKSENIINELKKKIEENNAKIAVITEELHNTELSFIEKQNEISTAEMILSDLREGKDRVERQLSEIISEKADLNKKTAVLGDEKTKSEKDLSETESYIADIQSEQDSLREEADKLAEKITLARIALGAAQSDKTGVDSLAERIEDAVFVLEEEINRKETELESLLKEKEDILSRRVDVDRVAGEKEKTRSEIENKISTLSEKHSRINEEILKSEIIRDKADKAAVILKDRRSDVEIKAAKLETRLENLKNRLWEEFEISFMAAGEFRSKEFVMSSALKESRTLKSRIRELGDVNVGAIKEYEEVNTRHIFYTEQRDDINESMRSLQDIIDETDRIIKRKFKDTFNEAVRNFEKIFVSLFGGGYARLLLEDENEPLKSSIEIVAQPPGKALKNINLLSGGEKSMTAIALMFAVLKTKPTSFCILDEVEAALDDANIERFAKYLKKSFKDIQFVLVTHKRATMEYADVLYGVTMPEQGISKILSLELSKEPAEA